MLTIYLITHYLLPHESNNHRPKLVHSSTLLIIASFFMLYQFIIFLLPRSGVKILGYASNISVEEVVRLTNERRAQSGLAPLELNETLSGAARMKGEDMLNKDYWAHIAPDGTQPWKFFTDSGYNYRFAGENLARDFSNASSAVDAWMASSTHKDNILSSKYQEIGIAVLEGDLAGVDTTLIVQLFGTRTGREASIVPIAEAKPVTETEVMPIETAKPLAGLKVVPTEAPKAVVDTTPLPEDAQLRKLAEVKPMEAKEAGSSATVLISPFRATKGISVVVIILLLIVFILDAILVTKRKIARVAGRTFAHIAFLSLILAIALILRSGRIL